VGTEFGAVCRMLCEVYGSAFQIAVLLPKRIRLPFQALVFSGERTIFGIITHHASLPGVADRCDKIAGSNLAICLF